MKDGETKGRRKLSLGPVLTPFVWLWGVAMVLAAITGPVTLVLQFGWRILPLLPLPLALFLLWGYGCLTLKIVWADERELHVRGFFKTIAVPYSQIAELRCECWPTPIPVLKVVFKEPTRFGKHIRYVPRRTLWWRLPSVHPDIVFLQEKMGQTPGHAERG